MTKQQFQQWSEAVCAQVEATAEQQAKFADEIAKQDATAGKILQDMNELALKLAKHLSRNS